MTTIHCTWDCGVKDRRGRAHLEWIHCNVRLEPALSQLLWKGDFPLFKERWIDPGSTALGPSQTK